MTASALRPEKIRRPRRDWTRDELIVAFNLYCRIPFGRIHIRNPEIISLANALGRTPSSVSWKLANFARFDPALQKRHIRGASHGSRAEEEIWKEFSDDWDSLAFESQQLLARIMHDRPLDVVLDEDFPEGKTKDAIVKARVNQGFFRSAVLAAHKSQCCITSLAIPALLTASHIVPWAADKKNRTNPRNGLCLNAIHDKAFDSGLVTVTPDYRVVVSNRLKRLLKGKDPMARLLFVECDGRPIRLPSRFVPDQGFLKYHNQHCFKKD
jgi:putative restriction endonuclease